MKEYSVSVTELKALCPELCAGDRVFLSGTVYTSRDAAHRRLFDFLEKGETLPYTLKDAVIYYAGPTPTPQGLAIGSCGPTTSSRMDPYTPRLYDLGVTATIGKGDRSDAVAPAIIRNTGVYLCATGGAGALAAKHIAACEVIAFDDLGCESVKKLTLSDFPLTVGIDCHGGNLFVRQ